MDYAKGGFKEFFNEWFRGTKIWLAVLLSIMLPCSGLILLCSGKARTKAIIATCILTPTAIGCFWVGLLGGLFCLFPFALLVVPPVIWVCSAAITLKEGLKVVKP